MPNQVLQSLSCLEACSSWSASLDNQGKARAFAELVMHIENSMEQGMYKFQLIWNYMLPMKNV